MLRIGGTYQAVVRVKKVLMRVEAENKEDATRTMLIELASEEDQSDFIAWVDGGMEIELSPFTS